MTRTAVALTINSTINRKARDRRAAAELGEIVRRWREGGRMTGRDGGVLLALLCIVTLGIVAGGWAILAHSTLQDRAQLSDSMGPSTGIRWDRRETQADGASEPSRAPEGSRPEVERPATDALRSGRACLPMGYLLSNRPLGSEYGFPQDVSCERKGLTGAS